MSQLGDHKDKSTKLHKETPFLWISSCTFVIFVSSWWSLPLRTLSASVAELEEHDLLAFRPVGRTRFPS